MDGEALYGWSSHFEMIELQSYLIEVQTKMNDHFVRTLNRNAWNSLILNLTKLSSKVYSIFGQFHKGVGEWISVSEHFPIKIFWSDVMVEYVKNSEINLSVVNYEVLWFI